MQRRTLLGIGVGGFCAASLPFRCIEGSWDTLALRIAVERIGAARRKIGLPDLVINPTLAETTRRYTRHLHQADLAGHIGPGGEDPSARAKQLGYAGRVLAEILTETYEDPAETIAYLLAGAATREILFDRAAGEFGLGVFRGNDRRMWWDLVIGAPV